MTSDVVCDATVEYIIASEQHFDLALRVEKAMAIIRERLVEEVVRDVEKRFSESDCWKVVSTDYGNVMKAHSSLVVLRKNGWYEHGNEDPTTGIHLSSDKNFSPPYVCLHLHKSYIDEKGGYIVERFEEFETYLRNPEGKLNEGVMWKNVPGDWGWENQNFFKRAVDSASEKREEVVKQFIRMIDDMAAKIDATMKNLGRNA